MSRNKKIFSQFLSVILSLGLGTIPNSAYSRLPNTSEIENHLLLDQTLRTQLLPQFTFFPGCGNLDSFENLEQILINIGNTSPNFRYVRATIDENSSYFSKRTRVIGLLPSNQESYIFKRSPKLGFSVSENGEGYFLRREPLGILRYRNSNLNPDFFCFQVEKINNQSLN